MVNDDDNLGNSIITCARLRGCVIPCAASSLPAGGPLTFEYLQTKQRLLIPRFPSFFVDLYSIIDRLSNEPTNQSTNKSTNQKYLLQFSHSEFVDVLHSLNSSTIRIHTDYFTNRPTPCMWRCCSFPPSSGFDAREKQGKLDRRRGRETYRSCHQGPQEPHEPGNLPLVNFIATTAIVAKAKLIY